MHGLGAPSDPSDRVTTSDSPRSPMDDLSDDELPFEPRDVSIKTKEKFEDFYDLDKEVGKGKFGVVYRCTEKSSGRTWAAKILKVREKDREGVRQEVAVMNRLRHPKLLLLWDAFDSPRRMVLVMEYIGAGELFERVIGDDFVLTERDCVHFLRQICEGVAYMHSQSVLHLDLKPENILCIAENSNRIKIIDFGLARPFQEGQSVKVMFGTPEFIAPEVINYDEIGFATDMWSVGVICYVLISGLSPFLGDNDAETLASVTSGDYDFDDEAFDEISDQAKDFISKLLVKKKEKRLLTAQCLSHDWLTQDEVDGMRYKRLNTERLRRFMVRRKWLKTGNAVLAVSRLLKSSSLSSFSRSNSNCPDTPSTPGTPDTARSLFSPDVITSRPALTEEQEVPQDSDPASGSSDPNTSCERPLPNGSELVNGPSSQRNLLSNDSDIPNIHNNNNNNNNNNSSNNNNNNTSSESSKTRVVLSVLRSDVSSGNTDTNTNTNTDTNTNTSSARQAQGASFPDMAGSSQESGGIEQPSSDTGQLSGVMPGTASGDKNLDSGVAAEEGGGDVARGDTLGGDTAGGEAPVFQTSLRDCQVFAGDAVRFDVMVSGRPRPTVSWFLEGEELEADSRHVMEHGGRRAGECSLIVRDVGEGDEGEYTCRAENLCGHVTCSADLSILEL
ncbi:myosin light chain kinase, smooth muscle [Aplysia californica]|uniref:Myosin light chain kinase, smooth muscle n=1 Tax=Aplysia californica TaxID=6500 RepID=A0ABM1AA74_APLCA|nr:myosin light chain kinase, smooth muscle [Aplysia californica]